MAKKPKMKSELPPAKTEDEISDAYNRITDDVAVMVQMGPESRQMLREFLEAVDENLTVADVKSALEADWS